MKKTISLLMALSLFLLLLCSCTKQNAPMPKDTKSIKDNQQLGVTVQDYISKQGSSVYYYDSQESIYRCDLTDNKHYLISKVSGYNSILVYNDYIYAKTQYANNFTIYNPTKGICKITLDGKKKTRILSDYTINQFTIQNGKIYFTTDELNRNIIDGALLECDLNGNNVKQLSKNATENFYINDEYAYYHDTDNVYRLNLETLEVKSLEYYITSSCNLSIINRKLYVIRPLDDVDQNPYDGNGSGFTIDEIDFDTCKTKSLNLKNIIADSLMIYDGKIYSIYTESEYTDDGDETGKGYTDIYRYDLNGRKDGYYKHYTQPKYELHILDDGLYCIYSNYINDFYFKFKNAEKIA